MDFLITLSIVLAFIAVSHLLTEFTLEAKTPLEKGAATLVWFGIFRMLVFILGQFIADRSSFDSPWGMRLAGAGAGILISALTVVRIHLNGKVVAQAEPPAKEQSAA